MTINESKTKAQLLDELKTLHKRISELEQREASHKKAEEVLWESKERFRIIMEETG